MSTKKTPTLAGRILRGVLRGVLDGLPGVSQVANVIRQHKAEKEAPQPVATDEPVTRTLTGWLTLVGVVAGLVTGLANGVFDCDAAQRILEFFGVL
jgi:hypothetical protein